MITKQSMTAVVAMLPEKQFIRTHRSIIVSIGKIKTFTSELITALQSPISPHCRLKEMF
ncbi:MAG TPA: LytTR family transcriptional regulator DNA-binding domain-containing protein [Chitinophagaceae bacterium]